MFEDQTICPYTGLRSFTEEESIYFKGRDEHIKQATAQLEKNKFLMLTGASGDGKSSLVYAGIVPNARSGFLKSKYSNWSLVDFRPERTPLRNLCKSLAKALEIPNVGTVETELRHGFSALVDLYKSSKRYIDETSSEWQQADDTERATIKRGATNLIILADQFEEFFTNPENYHKGVPSTESALTINLLLETAKIALESKLPIFIVFTMRSDYIGQCAAFRGLPEYIGFSQFFVPRLNRSQLQEVIEEPAVLSGNKISRRLAERLIHDISDGEDQLPILQHTLNQIWVAAVQGKEEMDLSHYAMVGGMAITELPSEDQTKTQNWFDQLSIKIKNCYRKPGLHNVLDTHANKLLVGVADYVKTKTKSHIPEETIHHIVKIAFSCLTKIDQSRSVRNRMTLEEITNVIGDPKISINIVAATLQIFREPGNTFIRPFIFEDQPDSIALAKTDVLDITHESLIRNWAQLGSWAEEEFDHYTTYEEFYQQVTRWVANDKSGGFLLPIGPLTYFENWFNTLNPNKYWVNRYIQVDEEDRQHLEEAEEAIDLSKEFLERSASKHAVTRAVMRFGPRRIAAVLLVVLTLALSSFFYADSYQKRNDSVLKKIDEDGFALLQDSYVSNMWKRTYLVNRDRLEEGAFEDIIARLPLLQDKIIGAVSTCAELTLFDKRRDNPLILRALAMADSLLQEAAASESISRNFELTWLLNFIEATEITIHYNPDPILDAMVNRHSRRVGEIILMVMEGKVEGNWLVKELNEGIEYALNHKAFSEEEVQRLVDMMSPLDGGQNSVAANFYRRDRSINVGAGQHPLAFNGLYEELAFLYARLGKVEKALQCIDTLHSYHFNFNDYTIDGYSVAAYFAKYGYWNELQEYANAYSIKRGHPAFEFYERVLARAGLTNFLLTRKAEGGGPAQNQWHNTVLEFLEATVIDQLYQVYHDAIVVGSKSTDERHFNLALYYKHLGIYQGRRKEDVNSSAGWKPGVFDLFEKSWLEFGQVGKAYLQKPMTNVIGGEPNIAPAELLYMYPDLLTKETPIEPRFWQQNYSSGIFFEFLFEKGYANELYPTFKDVELVTLWINDSKDAGINSNEYNSLSTATLQMVEEFLSQHPESGKIDKNLVRLLLAVDYYEQGETEKAMSNVSLLEPTNFSKVLSGVFDYQNNLSFQLIGDIFLNLVRLGEYDIASSLLVNITDGRNRASIYTYTSGKLTMEGKIDLGRAYLDSAKLEVAALDKIEPNQWDFRKNLAFAVALLDENGKQNSMKLIRNLDDNWRFLSVGMITRAMVHKNNYYLAYSDFPKFTSKDTRMYYINNMLYEMNDTGTGSWKTYDDRFNWIYNTIGYAR